MTRPQILYILGAGHCGSTLLSMLLNAHRDCLAVSEISMLATAVANRDPVLETDLWREARTAYEQEGRVPFEQIALLPPSWREFVWWPAERIAKFVEPRAALMRSLAHAAHRTWIVDASKAWQQLYLMERSQLFDVRVVHLVRDGRGIVYSYAKKYGGPSYGLSKWLKSSAAAIPMASWFGDRWLRVRYEDLGHAPADTLTKICEFAGIAYDPAMLEFRSQTWHGIGGNRMSKRGDSTIRLDERWRREMSRRDRLVVDLVGGAVNRYYGY